MPTSERWIIRPESGSSVSVPADEKELVRIAEEHFADSADQIVAESAAELRYARRDPTGHFVGFESRGETAELLGLLPHPEGGWYRRTWETDIAVTPPGYGGQRPTGTAIYCLLLPGEASRWHRVRSDEIYLWHRGGPLTLWLGGAGAVPDQRPTDHRLGADLAAGERPQLRIPAGTWQRAEPAAGAEVLISCVVSPGFDFADFTVLD